MTKFFKLKINSQKENRILRGASAHVLGHFFGVLGICFVTLAAWIGASIVLFSGYKLSLLKRLKSLRK